MKKTFTANISGTVFHIEEDAYDQLQRYLANVRAKFSGSSGSDEIMADIEARIAELFHERLQGRQVVTTADVDHVKGVMGQPEDFEGSDEGPASSAADTASAPLGGPRRKRLFRDPDDHWVGGVIGGLAAYFNFDPLWLRIAFGVFLVLGWGVPVVVYLVMWVLVPKAETPAERLAMRGEPVTVENIKRVFDESAERVKAGARRVAGEAEALGEKWRSGAYAYPGQRTASGAERFFRSAFQVLGKVVGVAILLLGLVLAFGFITLAIGGAGLGWFTTDYNGSLHTLLDSWFVSPDMAFWSWAGLSVLCLVPVVGLLLAGFRLLFEIPVPRWIGWTLVPLWFASMVLLAVMGVRQAQEFRQHDKVTATVDLAMPADRILHIAAAHDPWFGDSRSHYDDDLDMIEIDGEVVRWGYAALDVRESPDSLFHLEVTRSAHGVTFKEASRRAQAITATYTVQDSLLTLSPVFTSGRADRLRGQMVQYIVWVPMGAAVRFERGTARIIYDIKNTTDTWDGDMVGRTWTMTPQGLQGGTPSEVRDPAPPPQKGTVRMDVRKEKDGRKSTVRIRVAEKRPPFPSLVGLLRSSIEA
ncbi:MAG: PspC domain-containing protein [Bacteroidetes bacterium]|nr:PspC domain-containing protein [Bacteroidota bacterium]